MFAVLLLANGGSLPLSHSLQQFHTHINPIDPPQFPRTPRLPPISLHSVPLEANVNASVLRRSNFSPFNLPTLTLTPTVTPPKPAGGSALTRYTILTLSFSGFGLARVGLAFFDAHFGRFACRAGHRDLVCWLANTPTETYRREESTDRSACATKRKYDRMPWRWRPRKRTTRR